MNINISEHQIINALKRLGGCLTLGLLATLTAPAATITFGPATTIAGDTDVSTSGTLAYAYHWWNGGDQTVNGVTFTGVSAYSGANFSLTGSFSGAGAYFAGGSSPFIELSAEYRAILTGSFYNNGSAVTVTLKNLAIGNQYAVQVWLEDARIYGIVRGADVAGGNTVHLDYNSTDVDGGVGQFTIGTFTADGTNQTFTITGTPGIPPGAGASAQLNALQLRDVTPPAPPTITSQPQDTTNYTGHTASFSVAASGVGIYWYQWYFNNAPLLSDANGSTYTIPIVTTNDAGGYSVEVFSPSGSVTSRVATLTVLQDVTPPTIVSNYFQVTDAIKMSLVFNERVDLATATNLANYTLDGGPTVDDAILSGDSLTVTLTIGNLLLGDNVSLHVNGVKDLSGNTIAATHITAAAPSSPVNYALVGTATQKDTYPGYPASRAIDGNTGNLATTQFADDNEWWEVDLGQARPVGIVKVYWRSDCCGERNKNVDLVIYDDAAHTTEVLRLPISTTNIPPNPLTVSLGAGYTGQVVRLEHPTGVSEYMGLAEVQVMPPANGLVISGQPQNWNAYVGDRVFLFATVTGTEPVSYQWQTNGVNLPNATNTSLVLTDIALSQAGNYTLIASNALRVRTSETATVVVNPRPSLGDSLVAQYTFDTDTDTNVVDVAPMNPAKTAMHDALKLNATWLSDVTDFNGVSRQGVMQFAAGAANNEMVVTAHPDLNTTNGAITVWAKSRPYANLPNRQAILFWRLSGGGGVFLGINDPASTALVPGALHLEGSVGMDDDVSVADDTWHHIACVYTFAPVKTASLYIDGTLAIENTINSASPGWSTNENYIIGFQHYGGLWTGYDGELDDLRFYNRTLSAAEVASLTITQPTLSISNTGTEVILNWSGSGYTLQTNNSVANPSGWADLAGATNGPVTNALPGSGMLFYRLKK